MGHPLDGTVVVTGASSGIGEALARQLGSRSAHLVLMARRVARLETLAQALRRAHPALQVTVLPCDLSDMASIDAAVASLADVPIDGLINNAGIGDIDLFEDADVDKLHRMILVNVAGLTRLTRLLVEGMVARRHGVIVNISSGFGVSWMPGFASYVGTKHYVTGFSEALRSELAPAGVSVTQVCPGPVQTEFEDQAASPLQTDIPDLVQLTAEQCAAEAIRGAERGHAIVLPGRMYRWSMYLLAWIPRWVVRLSLAPVSRSFRKEVARLGRS
jgi:short-subunit dehydrogenase